MRKLLTILLVSLCIQTNAQFVNNTGIVITNSANVFTNGDWQNSGTIRNNGTITTSGSWQNSGTMDITSTGGFVLQYDSNESFIAGSNSARIKFLQKEGAGNATITGKVRVLDSLKILGGLIKMNTAADSLGITPTTLILVSNGSYVDGPMANFGAGTFLFPVGRAGKYLAIKFYNSNSARVGVAVADAQAGFAPGDAVQSLTGFPFVWNTVTAQPANTASYLEVQVPDTLVSGVANPVVVRKVNAVNEFEGMGSRLVSSDGTNTTIRSYSSGLLGMFAVANGFPGTMLVDSAELVALYSSTGGGSWANRTNWIGAGSKVGTWFGVTEKGGRVTRVEMPNNNVTGAVPTSIVNMNALKVFNVATNKVTSIPNFTALPGITSLDVSGNNLDFGSLESNAALIGVNYVNQDSISGPLYAEVPVNTGYQLNITVGGASNQYKWKLNGTEIPGATSNTYDVTSINRSNMGDYILEVTNPLVPGLVLTSGNQRLLATADVSGTFFATSTDSVDAGVMRLLKVTSTGSYDTIRVLDVIDGAYLFDNVVLDDYLINGFADTTLQSYKKAIPTYYIGTIFWEEADTLVLEDNIAALDIYSSFKPEPPTTGQGEITGTFFGVDDPDNRVEARARVAGAAVTVRRGQGSGRGKDNFTDLVAYTFTDENGEFTFDKLDVNEYKLNIQLPGYPMDTTSDIFVSVGNTLFDRQVGVSAIVSSSGKIEVEQLVITGWQEEYHSFSVYPNPTVDYLFVKSTGNDRNVTFQLNDASGKAIHVPTEWNVLEQRWELSIKDIEKGVYILQVHKNKKNEAAHILVR